MGPTLNKEFSLDLTGHRDKFLECMDALFERYGVKSSAVAPFKMSPEEADMLDGIRGRVQTYGDVIRVTVRDSMLLEARFGTLAAQSSVRDPLKNTAENLYQAMSSMRDKLFGRG